MLMGQDVLEEGLKLDVLIGNRKLLDHFIGEVSFRRGQDGINSSKRPATTVGCGAAIMMTNRVLCIPFLKLGRKNFIYKESLQNTEV